MPVDGDAPLLRPHASVQQGQQGGLSCSRPAHDGQQLSAVQRKAQVMHAVVTVREAEVDVAAAEFHAVRLVLRQTVGGDDGRIVDGMPLTVLQDTALQPHLIGALQHGYVVQEHRVTAHIGENQQSRLLFKQGLQRAVEAFYLVQFDALRRLVGDKGEEIVVLAVRDGKLLGHRSKQHVGMAAVAAAELHQSQQEQRLLTGANLTMQTAANRADRLHGIQVFCHPVCHAHVAVQVQIEVDIPDSEMMTQITHQQILCSLLFHLLHFSEKGKQADETRQYDVSHFLVLICKYIKKLRLCSYHRS